jgi:hypothetical protein
MQSVEQSSSSVSTGVLRVLATRCYSVSSIRESADKRCHAYHNGDVCQVEYSRVQRANVNDNKVSNQTLPSDSVDEVAHATRQNQREANE